jgi:hypothetical protein
VSKTRQLDLDLCVGVPPPLGTEEASVPLHVLLRCLEVSSPPCPMPTKVLFARSDKPSTTFLQFESSHIRDAAFRALLCKTHNRRIIFCYRAQEKGKKGAAVGAGPGPDAPAADGPALAVAPAGPEAMEVDVPVIVELKHDRGHSQLDERLRMAAEARGIQAPSLESLNGHDPDADE